MHLLRNAIMVVLAVVATACSSSDPAPAGSTSAGSSPPGTVDPDAPPPAANLDEVEFFAVTERTHVDGLVDYPSSPPVGGNHLPFWQNCGFYTAPVLEESAVHSLEHGVVWITYQPGLDVATLATLAEGNPRLIVSPLADQTSPVIATAWGRQLQLQGPDDPRVPLFIEAFQDGEAAPEAGASCEGQLGTPPDMPLLLPNGQRLNPDG